MSRMGGVYLRVSHRRGGRVRGEWVRWAAARAVVGGGGIAGGRRGKQAIGEGKGSGVN
jgi:hypothetical protein